MTPPDAELSAKEQEIKDYSDKLDLIDTEINSLKLEIARLEIKKLESIGIRKQASHVLGRLKLEHESLKRAYFRYLRENP